MLLYAVFVEKSIAEKKKTFLHTENSVKKRPHKEIVFFHFFTPRITMMIDTLESMASSAVYLFALIMS